MSHPFTRGDLLDMLNVADNQGLPPTRWAEFDDDGVTLYVADEAAVRTWAGRLERPVEYVAGFPRTSFERGHWTTIVREIGDAR